MLKFVSMDDYQSIAINDLVLFEKASMPNNSQHTGALEERACFLYISKGQNISIEPMGGTKVIAKQGMLKRCGNYVSQFFSDDPNECCEGVAIFFYPSFIRNLYNNEIPQFMQRDNTSFNTKVYAGSKFIEHYIVNLLPYFDDPNLMDEELAKLKIKELILILLKSEKRNSVLDFFSELFASPTQLELKQVVENNIYNSISIDQLAFLCNMSLSTFKREFKKSFETSPASYIRTRKIEKAQRLLQASDLRIQEIGYQCGFNELSTFSHTFQKVTGYSPSEYRVNQKSKFLN